MDKNQIGILEEEKKLDYGIAQRCAKDPFKDGKSHFEMLTYIIKSLHV